jgi:hypothetical protein
VWAKLDAGRGAAASCVERGMTPGLSGAEDRRQASTAARLGDRASSCWRRAFEVPEAGASCRGAQGLKGPLGCLTSARYGIAWGCGRRRRGAARSRRAYTVLDRKQFGRAARGPSSSMQAKLADMLTRRSRWAPCSWRRRLGELKDAKATTPARWRSPKRNYVRAWRCARSPAPVARPAGRQRHHRTSTPIGRHMLNLETVDHLRGDAQTSTPWCSARRSRASVRRARVRSRRAAELPAGRVWRSMRRATASAPRAAKGCGRGHAVPEGPGGIGLDVGVGMGACTSEGVAAGPAASASRPRRASRSPARSLALAAELLGAALAPRGELRRRRRPARCLRRARPVARAPRTRGSCRSRTGARRRGACPASRRGRPPTP